MTTVSLLIISERLAQRFSLIDTKKGKSRRHTTAWDMMGVRSTINHLSRTLLSRPSICWPSIFVLLAHNLTFKNLQNLSREQKGSRIQGYSLKMVQYIVCPYLPQLYCSGHSIEREDGQIKDLTCKTLLTKTFNFIIVSLGRHLEGTEEIFFKN